MKKIDLWISLNFDDDIFSPSRIKKIRAALTSCKIILPHSPLNYTDIALLIYASCSTFGRFEEVKNWTKNKSFNNRHRAVDAIASFIKCPAFYKSILFFQILRPSGIALVVKNDYSFEVLPPFDLDEIDFNEKPVIITAQQLSQVSYIFSKQLQSAV